MDDPVQRPSLRAFVVTYSESRDASAYYDASSPEEALRRAVGERLDREAQRDDSGWTVVDDQTGEFVIVIDHDDLDHVLYDSVNENNVNQRTEDR